MEKESDPQNTYRWMTAVIASTLVLVVAMGGMFAMRNQLLTTTQDTAEKHSAAQEKLAQRIDAMETTLNALNAAPATDETRLAALETQMEALRERLDALEKHKEESKEEALKAQAAALAAASASGSATRLKLAAISGKSYAVELAEWSKENPEAASNVAESLKAFASGGIPTEAEMIRELGRTLGDRPQSETVEDESRVGKINAHLKGLVRIRKTNVEDPYAVLRKEALSEDLSTLERHVERLPEAQRALLEDWLKQVKDRKEALEALDVVSRETGRL